MAHQKGFYEKYIKRPQDFLCASLALVVLSPVMAATAALVRLRLGSPVLFTQDRPGLDGKVFKLYKFRTMSTVVEDEGPQLIAQSDSVKSTRFERFLRDHHLDELGYGSDNGDEKDKRKECQIHSGNNRAGSEDLGLQ